MAIRSPVAFQHGHLTQARLRRTLRSCVLALTACCVSASAKPPEFKQGEKASVLIFTTTDCPVANAMLPEISRLDHEFRSKGVAFSLVHVDPDTTKEAALSHSKSYGVRIPIILDPHHDLSKHYKATRTPEAFVILPDGGVAYHGRINDLYHAPGKRRRSPTTHDLREALTSVVTGKKPPITYQPPVGCVIADFAR